MITLLALGTFAAGVLARVWQISVVGSVPFLAVPGVGWLDQSPMLLTSVAILIVALTGLAWWLAKNGGGLPTKSRAGALTHKVSNGATSRPHSVCRQKKSSSAPSPLSVRARSFLRTPRTAHLNGSAFGIMVAAPSALRVAWARLS